MRFNLVALDESEYYSQELQDKCGKILVIYMYCPDVAVNCCEITPSFELIPVDYKTENLLIGSEECPENEGIHEVLQESVWTSEPIYVHVSSIDRIPEVGADGTRLKYSSDNDFEGEEEALDYFQANQML